MNRKRVVVVLLVCALAAGGLMVARCAPVVERASVRRVYLPIVLSVGRCQHGVGLSGPCQAVDLLGVDWYYNWHWRPCGGLAGARFVPMIRDVRRMAELRQAVEYARPSGWLMGFNEPDLPEPWGYLTTPEEAAEAWRVIEREAAGIKLVSPVPSQEDFDWLWRMVAAYEARYGERPRFDAIAVHWYNWRDPGSVQPAKDYLLQVRREALAHGYDKPLWLTEFAGHIGTSDPAGGHRRLMGELIPWMRQQGWIGRYAWYASLVRPVESWCIGCQYCSLTREDGGLTLIGEVYVEMGGNR